ncbi:hypothetical protein OPT61_g3038 [Boeremia exigua]|uniref:Uncharacterized protein n=1 Tax=Boeremia exigua TaxID=749465 RepID=A0ACC2IJB9_9PLEO|nr:hypothetical protein OPT61_g3038 [Boeremia exigua]
MEVTMLASFMGLAVFDVRCLMLESRGGTSSGLVTDASGPAGTDERCTAACPLKLVSTVKTNVYLRVSPRKSTSSDFASRNLARNALARSSGNSQCLLPTNKQPGNSIIHPTSQSAVAAMHLILTGGTGLVGAAVLDSMLAQEAVTRISILSRRPVKMAEGHDKVEVILHNDFKAYDQALLDKLNDAQGCVWALGVSQNDVDQAKYVEITHDYTMAAARAFSTLHPDSPFTFVYVSGEGATQTPGMFTPIFGRVKGKTESSLLDFRKQNPNFRAISVRPGGVDSTAHPEIQPFIPAQPAWKTALIKPMNLLYKSMMTPTRPMGKVFTELAMSRGEPMEGSGPTYRHSLSPPNCFASVFNTSENKRVDALQYNGGVGVLREQLEQRLAQPPTHRIQFCIFHTLARAGATISIAISTVRLAIRTTPGQFEDFKKVSPRSNHLIERLQYECLEWSYTGKSSAVAGI